MAKHSNPLRLNENLVNDAVTVSSFMSRTAVEQIEFWAELGKHASANLTAAEAIKVMQGQSKLVVKSVDSSPIDVLALARKVQQDSDIGEVAQSLSEKGIVRYEAAEQGGGMLMAYYPDGTSKVGTFVNGVFKANRVKTSRG